MKKIDLYRSGGYAIFNKYSDEFYKGLELLKEITSMDFSAYIVGGTVRDILMHEKPHDVDIATNMPIDIIKKHYKTIEYGGGEKHGTVIVQYEGFDFELTQFRSESTYSDNRRPDDVKFVDTFEEDTLRRDFTINAMGLDHEGNIIDYHGGYEDIQNKIIRCVGNPEERFTEDSLRILRAARFAGKLKFEIDESTLEAMSKLSKTVMNVSSERITDEFMKAMPSNNNESFSVFIRYLIVTNVSYELLGDVSPSYVSRAKSFTPEVNLSLLRYGRLWTPNLSNLRLDNKLKEKIGYIIKAVNVFNCFNGSEEFTYERYSIISMVEICSADELDLYNAILTYCCIFKKEINEFRNLCEKYTYVGNEYKRHTKFINECIKSKGIEGRNFGKVLKNVKLYLYELCYETESELLRYEIVTTIYREIDNLRNAK